MSRCRKCGEEISFKWKNGKWWPANHDWDRCRELYIKAHPKLVNEKPGIVTQGKHKEFYEGEIPPWEEVLGDFMCFEGCCGCVGSPTS